ncbi:single-stranded DNA-binding protein [Pedobacter sp. G11]|uniref:single-stranded DNA-binding protein n=1 Tax=Pedobacter sp. G11 TaxID=2482728 RepID=UPI000F5EAE93|nr:single-stranded DNA-binding protein [Pedobacter sp. G11]AZI26433.1 single-stranded DNA-binding protein [Pedobacter sp. G11]
MMEITGRLTADAVVREVSAEKKVVRFTLAVNDSYLSEGKRIEQTLFVDCAFWRNSRASEFLKKGMLVQLYGRLGVKGYLSKQGEAKAQITFRVSEIKFFDSLSIKAGDAKTETDAEPQNDDLDFLDIKDHKYVSTFNF